MNELKGIIEDCYKSDLVSKEAIKKIIEIIGQEEWNYLYDENSNICTTMGELIITLKGIPELEKENAELKEENEKSNVLLADIIDAFASCSYNDDFEMAQAGKEIYELFYGGKDPKEVFHNAEVPKCSRQLLKEAKDVIKKLYSHIFQGKGFMELNDYNVQKAEAEQFLKENK